MKVINSKGLLTRLPMGFTILLVAIMLQSCGTTKYNFLTSSVVPAAEGSVKVNKDKNSNYSIDLDVKRLADPKRLSPARDMYIVWMETEQNGSKNIGQLKTSSGMFSNELSSSLKTVSTFKPTGFFITAEGDANIQNPAGAVVLSTGTR